jgi:proteic killer suppression protein
MVPRGQTTSAGRAIYAERRAKPSTTEQPPRLLVMRGTGSWRAAAQNIRLAIYRIPIYDKFMVQSFRDAETERIFQQQPSKQFRPIEKIALRKLIHLNQAKSLRDLAAIPGNRLEALKGSRKGRHSIRINDQYRICFVWKDGDAHDVEITDYH